MQLTHDELNDLVIAVALQKYGRNEVRRRPLMLAVEQRIRELGAWSDEDDRPSKSAGAKTAGLARIDWAFWHLKKARRLHNPRRNRWILP